MFQIVCLALSLTITSFISEANLSDRPQPVYSNAGEVIKMRVQGHRVSCQPGSEAGCFSVQKGASIGKENWEVLPQQIEGFAFEEGYTYDLIVKVDIQQDKTGPDSFKHTLVEIISKIKES